MTVKKSSISYKMRFQTSSKCSCEVSAISQSANTTSLICQVTSMCSMQIALLYKHVSSFGKLQLEIFYDVLMILLFSYLQRSFPLLVENCRVGTLRYQ